MKINFSKFGASGEIPRGFGVRQPSGALATHDSWLKSGRGLPQSRTLSRPFELNYLAC
jgi:hypothetical protein